MDSVKTLSAIFLATTMIVFPAYPKGAMPHAKVRQITKDPKDVKKGTSQNTNYGTPPSPPKSPSSPNKQNN